MLKVGVYLRPRMDRSVVVYHENVTAHFEELGMEAAPFSEAAQLPTSCDVLWDPGCTGGQAPPDFLQASPIPLVPTVHGTGSMAIKPWILYPTLTRAAVSMPRVLREWLRWRMAQHHVAAIITVSVFAKVEMQKMLRLKPDIPPIYPIYHGVDLELFQPGDPSMVNQPYFLHVSAYQPKKNLNRMISAYKSMQAEKDVDFLAIVPGSRQMIDGINMVTEYLSHQQLVTHYQEAVGFLFPSIHESFGMPILEAMACGCPVITANTTACAEVAGDAALLVDPYDVQAIEAAMRSLVDDEELRLSLSNKGLERAAEFTWRKSALAHREVFEQVAGVRK